MLTAQLLGVDQEQIERDKDVPGHEQAGDQAQRGRQQEEGNDADCDRDKGARARINHAHREPQCAEADKEGIVSFHRE
jgi:hypothetical protein